MYTNGQRLFNTTFAVIKSDHRLAFETTFSVKLIAIFHYIFVYKYYIILDDDGLRNYKYIIMYSNLGSVELIFKSTGGLVAICAKEGHTFITENTIDNIYNPILYCPLLLRCHLNVTIIH